MKSIVMYVVLTFFILSSSTAVYSQIKEEDMVYLNQQSEYYLVNEALVSPEGSALVPQGAIRGVNDVYYIEFQYVVVVKKGFDLQVLVEDLAFSNEDVLESELHDTFEFDFNVRVVDTIQHSEHFFDSEEAADVVMINVQVRMNEPNTIELYKGLMGGNLAFELRFFVV